MCTFSNLFLAKAWAFLSSKLSWPGINQSRSTLWPEFKNFVQKLCGRFSLPKSELRFNIHSSCGHVVMYFESEAKIGVTFNFDKQDVIDFTKFSKMTMYRASEANS